MTIKAVLFDLGWTLIETAEIPAIFTRILQRFGVQTTHEEIAKAHETNEKELDVVQGQVELGQEFWFQWNQQILKTVGVQKNREFLARKIDELWWEHADLAIYPDVMSTLTRLKANAVKMGIITNGLERDYTQILARLELGDWFDVVVGVDTVNEAKPDKKIFLHALMKLQVQPEEAIFIGDSIKYDYDGAKHAGLRPLLIDRHGKAPPDIATIQSLTEVLNIIQLRTAPTHPQ